MKKSFFKQVSLILVLIMCLTTSVACNRKMNIKFDYDVDDYITKLGNYKGVEYTPDDRTVSDSDVDEYIDSVRQKATTWTDFTDEKIAMGDKVSVEIRAVDESGNYVSELSTGDEYELVLGSGDMSNDFENFEESIVGILPGRTTQFDSRVADGASSWLDEYRGQTFSFTVAVVSAYHGELPELTDQYVNTASYGKYKDVASYREGVRKTLEYNLEQEKHTNRYEELIDKIMADTEISSYPENALQKQIDKTTASMSVYADIYGMELDEYCKSRLGSTLEEYAKNVLLEEMILQKIVEEENLTVTTKEYKDTLDKFAKSSGYADGDALIDKFGKEYVQQVMLRQKAADFIYDKSVPVGK